MSRTYLAHHELEGEFVDIIIIIIVFVVVIIIVIVIITIIVCKWERQGACGVQVVGHTIQEQGINSACAERVFRIDVGMSKGCGNGEPEVHNPNLQRPNGAHA